MLEVKVTRKCNICGKIMSNENYWTCEHAYAESGDYVKIQGPYTGTVNMGPSSQPVKTDVCRACWDKMQEPKGHP